MMVERDCFCVCVREREIVGNRYVLLVRECMWMIKKDCVRVDPV